MSKYLIKNQYIKYKDKYYFREITTMTVSTVTNYHNSIYKFSFTLRYDLFILNVAYYLCKLVSMGRYKTA